MSAEWIGTTVGEYSPFIYGKAIKKADQLNEGISVYGSNGVYAFSAEALVEQHAVIIGRKGSVGKVHLSTKPCWISDTAFYTTKDTIEEAYFVYYLLSSLGLEDMNTDAAVPGLNRNNAHRLEIKIPSTVEERVVLVEPLINLDKKIELNRQTNQTLEQIAQAIFKSWFVDFEPTRAKIIAKEQGANLATQELAAQAIICGAITLEQLAEVEQNLETTLQHAINDKLSQDNQTPIKAEQLKATAALFPNELVESELGEIPEGWRESRIEDLLQRLPVGKRYSQKTASESGSTPILDQGRTGIIGYHDQKPGVLASPEDPVIVFANHTCYMRMIMHNFSAIQNVLPFKGRSVNIYWLYFATLGKQSFVEYKGHWPDFIIKEVVVPDDGLTVHFGEFVSSLLIKQYRNEVENQALSSTRDLLLPKLLSGELSLGSSLTSAEESKSANKCESVADLLSAIEKDLPPKSQFYTKASQPIFECYMGEELPSSMKGLMIRGKHAEGGAEYFKLPKFLWELRNNKIVNTLFSTTVDGTTNIPFLFQAILNLMCKYMGKKIKFDQSAALVLLSFPKSVVRHTSELLETASKLSVNVGRKSINEDDLYIILKELQQHGLVQPLGSHSEKWRLINKFKHEIDHWD